MCISNQSTDPDGDDITYAFYLGASASTLEPVKKNLTGIKYTQSDLVSSIDYYWRVAAWDREGHTVFSDLFQFATGNAQGVF